MENKKNNSLLLYDSSKDDLSIFGAFLNILHFVAVFPLINISPFSFHSIDLTTTFLFLNLPILTVSPISIGKSTPSVANLKL